MQRFTSFKFRLVVKFLSNAISAILGVLSINITTRALGPGSLGQFDFTSQTSQIVLSLLTIGLGTSFYNWMCREQGVRALAGILTYFGWILFSTIVFFSAIALLSFSQIYNLFWPNIPTFILYLGVLYASLTYFNHGIAYWADGHAHTSGYEIMKLSINLVRTLVLLVLFLNQRLDLLVFFVVQNLSLLTSFLISGIWLWKVSKIGRGQLPSRDDFFAFFSHLRTFGSPLIAYGIIGFFAEYFDSWILQYAGGSVQQGFFGLGTRLGGVIFLFSSALTPIFTREIAISIQAKDFSQVRSLIYKVRIPVAITSFAGCFAAVNSDLLSRILGGASFADAGFTVGLLCLYPVYQTFGQLIGSLFYGSGHTKMYSNVGIVVMFLGAILAASLLLPMKFGYLDLIFLTGSSAMAVKLLLSQFISINLLLYFGVRRILGQSYLPWFFFQTEVIFIPTSLAYIAKLFFDSIYSGAGIATNSFSEFSFALFGNGCCYAILIFIFIWLRPEIIPIDARKIVTQLRQRMKLYF